MPRFIQIHSLSRPSALPPPPPRSCLQFDESIPLTMKSQLFQENLTCFLIGYVFPHCSGRVHRPTTVNTQITSLKWFLNGFDI